MKKWAVLTFAVALIAAVLTGCGSDDEASPTLTVGTFNIDAKVVGDHVAQRQLMADAGVDIFGVQEVNHDNRRFADKGIASYNPLPDFQQAPFGYVYYGNAIDFAGGGYGIATVSRTALSDESTTKLVSTPEAAQFADEFAQIYRNYDPTKPETVAALDAMGEPGGIAERGALEPRIFTRVVIEHDGRQVAFYNTHLSWESIDLRRQQMEQLRDAMKADPVPYRIAVGDFNADQSRSEFDLWRADFHLANGGDDQWFDTFAGHDESMKVNSIDNIIVSKNVSISGVRALDTTLSDHRPLVATLSLR